MRDRVIATAASIAVAQGQNGATPTQINDAICLATLGSGSDLGLDYDLKTLLRIVVFPRLGLLPSFRALVAGGEYDSPNVRRYRADCEDIDARFEAAYQRERRWRGITRETSAL